MRREAGQPCGWGIVAARVIYGEEERHAILQWIGAQETVSVEAVRDYVEARYGVVYRSKQSYYELLEAGGMSYHRSEKRNPKRDEAQILARREEIKKNWHRTGKPNRAGRGDSLGGGRMSLSVGRCLWHGLGEAEHAD